MKPAHRDGTRTITRAVRALLALYPSRFRQRFEREILASLRHDLDEAAVRGPRAFTAVATRELRQTAAGIIPQHRLERAQSRRASLRGLLMQHIRSLGADVRHAIRALRQAPLFTGVALAVLAAGIGASTAVFTVVDAVVLRPLPFPDHERLAVVLEYDPAAGGSGSGTTMQTFLDWRREQQVFTSLAASATTRFRMRNAAGEPVMPWGRRITTGFFELLGAVPAQGRAFTPDEETDGGPRVAIISHAFWMRHFAAAPDAIGRALEIDGDRWEIVGIMPEGFTYPVGAPQATDIYVPARIRAVDRSKTTQARSFMWLTLGRLRPGVTMEQAQEEMSRLTAALDAEHPRWLRGARTRVMSLHNRIVGGARDWMLLLLGSVTLVLLIGCANVANLMLARATVRHREIAIRAALGAGRLRLIRMQVVEGLVLAGAGALAGLVIAWAAVKVITVSLPQGLPRAIDIGIDLRVVLAAAAAAMATGLICGFLPALQSSRPNVAGALRDGGRSMTAGKGSRLRSMLVVVELALAVMLVISAGLFTASFVQLLRVDPGFDYRNVIGFGVGIPLDARGLAAAGERGGREAREAFFADWRARNASYVATLIDVIRQVPGVEAVAAVNGGVPLTGSYMRTDVTLPGRERTSAEDDSIDIREITPGYLELLRVPLRAGRLLTEDDYRSHAKVVVINESAAAKYWPGAQALGQRITMEQNDGVHTVVGVVGDIRHQGLERPGRQEAYVPKRGIGTLVIRTASEPSGVLPAIKRAIWTINPDQYLNEENVTLESHVNRLMAERRFSMALLSLLGVLALVIASAGVYGVMAYLVSQRRQEIGVRMALGAGRADVIRLVMARAGLLVTAGLAIGIGAAWMLSATVQRFLFLVAPRDWRILVMAATVLALSAAVACLIPARRAALIDPLIALRAD